MKFGGAPQRPDGTGIVIAVFRPVKGNGGFGKTKKGCYFCSIGRMAEWSIAAVLKTVELHGSGGSNPSPSAFFRERALNFVMNEKKCREI